jgi:hypothetical protein
MQKDNIMKKKLCIVLILAMVALACMLCGCHEHKFGEWIIVEEPSCTKDGLSECYCECGERLQGNLASSGHDYSVNTLPPTCTESGYTIYTCKKCGETQSDYSAPTGHSHTVSVVDPTCTEPGYTLYSCVCGDSYTESHVDAYGHEYIEGTCINCGDETHKEFMFKLSDDGSYYILHGMRVFDLTEIVIPSHYNGKPVQVINRAFYDYAPLQNVVIPDTVVSIEQEAFYLCPNLKTITIPASVTTIGYGVFMYSGIETIEFAENSQLKYIEDSAFYDCEQLESIVIPDGVKYIGNSCFAFSNKLTTITIPESVTAIGISAFWICNSLDSVKISSLESWLAIDFSNENSNPLHAAKHLYLGDTELTDIYIPESVTTISKHAFEGFVGLTSVTIHQNVSSIGVCAFNRCANLASINVSEYNSYYKSVDGHLYNADASIFIQYALANTSKTYTVLESTQTIANGAFRNAQNLNSVIITGNLTTIEPYAFYDSKIQSVVLPQTLSYIGKYAFDNYSLEKIYFAGSQTQWENIVVDGDNEMLHYAVIEYNYTVEEN